MLSTIPSRRHSSAIAYSPRRPDNTIRIFSSAEYRLRVAGAISRRVCSAVSDGTDFCLIFAPSRATMSQKSSLRKIPQSVSQLLTGNIGSELAKHFVTRFQKAKHPLKGLLRQRDIFEKQVKPHLTEGKVGYGWW